MMCIIKAKRSIVFWMLLLLTQLPVFAQDAVRENSAPQQNNPLGRLEVPDSEEQRRFVKEHSFNNPAFRQRQSERAIAGATPSAQASKQVRMIYLVPSDKNVRADYQNAIANAISDLQGFYRNQMGSEYTFSLHAPIVEVYQLSHTSAFYSTEYNSRPGGFYENVLGDGFALTGGGFDDPSNRWIFYVDADLICGQYTGGTNGIALLPANDLRGLTNQPTVPICPGDSSGDYGVNRWIGGLGHELGHALGLPHPPGCDNGHCADGLFAYNSLMYAGYAYYPGTYLLADNKSMLLAGGFFSALAYDIGGLITSSDNAPLAGATITINETQSSVASDANGSFSFTGLPAGGNYTVSVTKAGYRFTPSSAAFNNLDRNQTANFVGLIDAPAFQFSVANYQVGEGDGHVAVSVTRSDSIAEAVVDYATSDASGLNSCSSVTGMASSRCDYATTVGTLRFAPGETSKTINIPLVDDGLAEGTESLTISLSNPAAGSSTIAAATITITDNDATTGANPIDQTPFFVRQHYLDFLGREPDPAGLAGWQDVLNNCGTTVAQPCDRIEVSSAFFRSEEFQTRAYFVYRFYSAVGRIPLYEEFIPDFAKVSGFLSAQQLEMNKSAFVDEFMARSEFRNRYDSTINNPTAYVEALLQTIGLPDHPLKNFWTTELAAQRMTRAQVLRALTESAEVYQKYYTEAFVIMQYFGYLRRSADGSYVNWIQTMNSTGGDYRMMIGGFLNSAEYRQRFGN